MTCLCVWEGVIGALILVPGASAFADGPVGESWGVETVANIASPHMEVLSAIPDPQSYIHRYEMEYSSTQDNPFRAQIDQYYLAPIPYDHRYDHTAASSDPDRPSQQRVMNYLDVVHSAGPLIQIVQLPEYGSANVAHPQRRLTLILDQWNFSATARVSLNHSHTMGANLSVRRGF
ncbi:hypothetical protein [Paraburkholderia saeva]|uniref:Uncharacterized protein n=1 Tax=Paraburkholderia saeva TaxID=2777537 RepID=A0A9N8S0Q9_9BURK|nr:hypothetical protein [Paraburkholderia saeva]CAG4894862.1 hypothetical protein R70241_01889 [Paraburkholderia saeva]CAG4918439.1 hypothetical protein LMG31841_04786 [Paraburkholderia saeva]CAG4928524.1 hypothetical protein R52603_05709 [Paraburkholderia saeva]